MPSYKAITVGASLGRVRRAIFICTIALAFGLVTQLAVWSMLTFTELRWTHDTAGADETPLIVRSDVIDTATEDVPEPDDPAAAIRAVASTDTGEKVVTPEQVEAQAEKAQPRTLSQNDKTMGYAVHCAKGVGTAGMIAMLPLLMLAVLVGTSAAARGAEGLVGAFNLGIVLAMLVLPMGGALSLPWQDGALTGYESMAGEVQGYLETPATVYGPFVFYARYLLLPLACLAGVTLMYLRLSASVEQAILQGDALRVDPDIEAEASSIRVGTQGNRTANALNKLAAQEQARNQPHAAPAPAPTPPRPPMPQHLEKQVPLSPQPPKSDMPRRII